MGSDSNDATAPGAADGPLGEPTRLEDLVPPVARKMHCSLAQARLSLDAVLAALREAKRPLKIRGFKE